MCDIVDKFIGLMEPYIKDIEEKNANLLEQEAYLSSLEELWHEINGNAIKLFSYKNDSLIEKLLEKIESNISEYRANEYILKANISEVRHLPQYEIAKKYINDFYEYINNHFKERSEEYQKLYDEYQNIELINQYYVMFKEEKVFFDDIETLEKVLHNFDLSIDEKNAILIYILKENNKTYCVDALQDDFADYDEEKIKKIISENRNLLTKEYNELLTVVLEYVDLTKRIHDIVNYELINKININNILLAKKIWLLKKIEFNYHNNQYRKCVNTIEEFEKIGELLNRVKDIKDKKEVIRIIKGEIENEG